MSDQIKFSCLSCGQHIVCDVSESGRAMLCPACNANLTVPHLMSGSPEPASPPEIPPDEATAQAPVPEPIPVVQRTSGLAVASLICSLSSLVICVGWIPGIICGHLARYKIRHDPTLKGKGLATAGLVISYATVLFAVGSVAALIVWWSAIFKEAYDRAQQMMVTNKMMVYTQPSSPSDTNESGETPSTGSEQSPSPSSGAAVWTMDVKDAQIPDNPASGEIHGQDFQYKRALFRNGNLKFISNDGQESLTIHGLKQSVENNSFEFQPASGGDAPKIEIAWNDGGESKTETFESGYAMELKFEGARRRRVPGQIYLCLPDDSKSFIAGKFTIVLPKPKPKPQPAAQ